MELQRVRHDCATKHSTALLIRKYSKIHSFIIYVTFWGCLFQIPPWLETGTSNDANNELWDSGFLTSKQAMNMSFAWSYKSLRNGQEGVFQYLNVPLHTLYIYIVNALISWDEHRCILSFHWQATKLLWVSESCSVTSVYVIYIIKWLICFIFPLIFMNLGFI